MTHPHRAPACPPRARLGPREAHPRGARPLGNGRSGRGTARPLPKPLAQDHVRTLFAQITHPMDHALALLMLRCGLRVSEVARLRLGDLDWTQQSIRIDQGKGRKDRLVYLSADALAALRTCLTARPTAVPDGLVFWNQKRPHRPLSAKGIQKKIERYAQAAGIKASCHSLRHTFASNLLDAGAPSDFNPGGPRRTRRHRIA